jgi:hypothetical protein
MKKMQDLHTMNRIVDGPEQAHLKVSIQTVCIFFYCRFYSLTGLISLCQHIPCSSDSFVEEPGIQLKGLDPLPAKNYLVMADLMLIPKIVNGGNIHAEDCPQPVV